MRPAALLLLIVSALRAAGPEPLVPRVRDGVQPEIDRHLVDAQKVTFQELAAADKIKALFKPALRQRAVADPWAALVDLEARGLKLAEATGGLKDLPELVDRAGRFLDRPAGKPVVVPRGKLATLDDHVRHITAVLDAADKLRAEALGKLSDKDRAFAFARPAEFTRDFYAQVRLTDKSRPRLRDDRTFCLLWEQSVDRAKFAAAVRTLLQLTDPDYLAELRAAMAKATPMAGTVPDGITGPVLAVAETRHGWIVLGGDGKNAYDLKRPVAFLADLGGDDSYKGTVASSSDADHPFGVAVDFAGNDTYEPGELGLATGRLGVGCLIDRDGDDTYRLKIGSGGCGFAGVGLLVDEAGKDTYAGARFSLGAALAGVGLLFDRAGDDTYTAPGYSLGLGGPGGVGAVIDVAGNDRYRCGFEYGSGYNQQDAPTARPGDPAYQYDAFGLGMGLGRRTYPFSAEGDEYNLAGGVGVCLDLAGDDRSESSNFSNGCAYFFGIGLKLDFAGDDRHAAARYGLSAGPHYAMGLVLDYAGNDTYAPAALVYNLGCAYDRSVFLLADGRGDDTYEVGQTSGPGRADRGGWGVFADLAGRDTYKINATAGAVSEKGLGVFFDGGGEDGYPKAAGPNAPGNGVTRKDGNGGLLVDR